MFKRTFFAENWSKIFSQFFHYHNFQNIGDMQSNYWG